MSHVDEGTLTAYADEALDTAERKRVDAHLSACSACRALLEEARRLSARSHEILAGAAPAFAPPPSFDDLVARSRGIDEKKGLEGMSRLAWAASLALAIGLGWYARGIVRQQPGDLSPSGPVALSTDTSAAHKEVRPASLTPQPPSPLSGEGGGRRDRIASGGGGGEAGRGRTAKLADKLERDVKAEGRSIDANRSVALQRPADSARVDASADMAKTSSAAGAGAGGVIVSSVGEARTPARAPAPPLLQAAPRMLASAPGTRILTVPGLDIIRRRAIVAGSDVMRTVQSIDATHELELIQEPLSGERRRVPGDTARSSPEDTRSVMTIEREGYRIMARAKVSADSLRVLLSKLQ